MNDILAQAFDPEQFRTQGHQLIDLLADHLSASTKGETEFSQTWATPESRLADWESHFQNTDTDLLPLLQKVLDQSLHIHHPKYVGHQVGVAAPMAVLSSMVSSLLNNGMATYEVGQGAVAIERIITQEILTQIGWQDGDGFLTSGGTLGNLTALLSARNIQRTKLGLKETDSLAIMVSEQAHYCIQRAVHTMGWGDEGVIKVPTDERFKMRTELLPELLAAARDRGKTVISIVGSACTTSTGSFDDLNAIADFCAANKLWFHVDGAHGASAMFTNNHRDLIAGLERADSFIMDFHKMLLTPSLTTIVGYRNTIHSYATFEQQAQYLWYNQEELEWYNPGKRTYECTKLMMSIRVYAILKTYRTTLWSTYVAQQFDLGQAFGQLIVDRSDFELAVEPECNIVCFRYTKVPFGDINACNAFIRQSILEEGEFYIVQTKLNGDIWLRTTLMNPFTTLEHLAVLLEKCRAAAAWYVATMPEHQTLTQ
ncbi:MAG: pyridoxal-dependent decarboxylase [Bacteroidota bacterium]